ncbi:TetR family transcriptional regulator [Fontimonas sp. SYSU GA230001]|uniref:TetR family transcriptional regulator n=1 Tax=Fontimonas sp. SYSU GA230001 TaxID=3142450 RepID=UPI0032B4D7A3
MKKNLEGYSKRTGAAVAHRSGRQKLMEAALQLAASTRSLASLGLREVARQAGLNPNTFYRHFRSFDDLGLAVIDDLAGELRQGLRERRRRSAVSAALASRPGDAAQVLRQAEPVVRESVALVLDFVTEHQQAYVVGIRELHGTSPVLRDALRRVFDQLAADMAEDVLEMMPLPQMDPQSVREIAAAVIRQMAFFSMDYLEQPSQREAICGQAERFILMLLWGALATGVAQPGRAQARVANRS